MWRDRAARLSLRGHFEGRARVLRLVADAELPHAGRGGDFTTWFAGRARRGWLRGRGAVVGVVSAALVLLCWSLATSVGPVYLEVVGEFKCLTTAS